MNSLILGTFLPFHKGHEALIRFSTSMSKNTIVLISTRNKEPIAGWKRFTAIKETFPDALVFHHTDNDAPQSPKDDNDVEFWDYWKNVINEAEQFFGITIDTVISSEAYGSKVADVIGAKHVPFDPNRKSLPISGTKIRNTPAGNMTDINIFMAKQVRKKFVMFGAESVGKSTMTSKMAELYNVTGAVEYARPFLEAREDKSPSVENMHHIFTGQWALEGAVSEQLSTEVVQFFDTDILSTFGYASMIGMCAEEYNYMLRSVKWHKDRVYLVLAQDEVPFEPDMLRYGGNKRESTDQFWIKLLEKHQLPYHYITGSFDERAKKISAIVDAHLREIFNFERD